MSLLKVLLIDLYCKKESHFGINTLLTEIFLNKDLSTNFLGLASHINYLRELHHQLGLKYVRKWEKLPNLGEEFIVNKYLYSIIYFFHFIYILKKYLTKKDLKDVIFLSSDYKIFPILILIFDFIHPINFKVSYVIHKPNKIIGNNFNKYFWSILFKKKFFNLILIDSNSVTAFHNLINIYFFKNKIKILDFSKAYWPLKESKNSNDKKVFCNYNDLIFFLKNKKLLMNKNFEITNLDKNYWLIDHNKNSKKYKIIMSGRNRTSDAIEYLNLLNSCSFVLVNKTRENNLFTSGLRIDAKWSKRKTIEI